MTSAEVEEIKRHMTVVIEERQLRKRVRPASAPGGFPIRDRYTVSGHVVGDVCFTCRCRVVEVGGGDGMILAWCECEWPDDAHEMEVL